MNRLYSSRKALLTGAAITVVVNTGIAILLWLSRLGSFMEQMVYSQGIGLSIWAITNAGAVWLARPTDPGGFPRGWRAGILVPGATLLGIANGTWVGDLYSGRSTWELGTHNPALAGKLLVMSLAVSLSVTVVFYLRGRSSYLEAELQRTKAQQAEAQLRLLESQLEPHMLFNTLANLRVLIGLDPARAQSMLDHLVAYLRSTLTASRTTTPHHHTLALEFNRLNDYLALMTIRMGSRLKVQLHLPPELSPCAIPPLLLQPLVENAISHGLEPHVEGGMLEVTARTTTENNQRWLVLEVKDNGAGLAHTAPNAPQPGHGFGLTQVRERLATTYGSSATLTLDTTPPTSPEQPGWTVARVRIPQT